MAESKSKKVSPYSKLLYRVCDELLKDDIEKIKMSLKIDGEIPNRELEEISSAVKLIDAMDKRELLGPDNTDFLHDILKVIKRDDLAKDVEKYKEDCANSVTQAPTCNKEARCPQQVESPEEGTAKKEPFPLHTASSDSQLQKSAKPSNRYHLLHSESSPGLSNANQPVIGSTGGQSPLLDVQGTTRSQPGTRNIGASPHSPLNLVSGSGSRSNNHWDTGLTFSNHVESEETFPKQRVGFDGNAPRSGHQREQTAVKGVNSSVAVGNFERPQLPASLDSLSSQTAPKQVYGESGDLEEDSACGATTAQAAFSGNEPAGEMTERYEGVIRQASVPLEHLVQDGVPTKQEFHLRKYQRELANEAIKGTNTIICAPTGSGKTLTAAYISRIRRSQVLKNGRKFKAVFIVCIRNLIQQQKDAFETIFPPMAQDNIVGAISQTSDNLKTCLLGNDIVMLTAQILVNAIKEGDVKIADLDLMIMDECHHTDLDHPYNMIMRLYMTEKKNREQRGESTECLPQIIGLSASLGTGKGSDPLQHYYRVCANLDCFTISHVRNPVNEKELLCINPKPKTDQIKLVPPRSSYDPFITMVKQMMEESEKEVSFPMGLSKNFDKGSQGYENWVIENRNEAERQALHTPEMRSTMITCRFLRDLNSALMLYDDLRGKDALDFLTKKIMYDDRSIHSESPEVETKLKGRFLRQYGRLQSHCEAESPTSNKMLEELYRLLTEQFEKNPESKGIVLIRTREGCSALERCIKENIDRRLVRARRMTGQSGDTSMTDVQQQKVIKAFKEGLAKPDGINLLVATDVAQEGLDIPKCNLMIRYNFVSNEIGSVQSKGRARAKESECYLIVPDGSINANREFQNMNKEHAMMEALKDFDKLDPEEVRRNIKEKQDELWGRHLQAQAQSNARQSELDDGTGVQVLCKECKAVLCRGNFIIKKGSHYICVDPDFPKKIREEKIRGRDFRTDVQVGVSICRQTVSCGQSFGPVLEYKQGSRRKGYTLSKDKIMLLYPGKVDPVQVKKWPSVSFKIGEEDVKD